MATTTLTATTMTKGASAGTAITQGGTVGTAINTSNTMRVLYPKEGRLLIYVDSDNAATAPVFAASDVYTEKGLGSLTPTAVGSGAAQLFLIDGARHKQSTSGYVQWTWAASSAGYCHAFIVP